MKIDCGDLIRHFSQFSLSRDKKRKLRVREREKKKLPPPFCSCALLLSARKLSIRFAARLHSFVFYDEVAKLIHNFAECENSAELRVRKFILISHLKSIGKKTG